MINFPFFQHCTIKIIFQSQTVIDEKLVNKVANLLITIMTLKVVSRGKYQFTNHGLTKFWILSQSHLIVHSWPENNALHIDLMTCSPVDFNQKTIKSSFVLLPIKDIIVTKLKY